MRRHTRALRAHGRARVYMCVYAHVSARRQDIPKRKEDTVAKRLTTLEVRKSNRNSIMRILHKNSQMSKQEISQELNLSMPTVTQNLKELEEQGLVEYKGSYESTGGRKAKKVSFVFDAKISIGIELSSGYTRFIAIDLLARVIFEEKIHMELNDIELYKKMLTTGLQSFISKNKLNPDKILGVGITIPGTFVEAGNIIIIEQSPTLKLKSVIAQDLAKDIPFKCIFSNDADAAGFAELWHDKTSRSYIYILLKNGVGGAVLLDNKPFTGNNNRAGEIGHMTLVPGGELCACGKVGCCEAYLKTERLTEKYNCDLTEFFRNVSEGKKDYVETLSEYMNYLAIAINNVRMIFDCDVILGGELNEYLEAHLLELKGNIEQRNTFYDNADFLKFAYFGSNATAIGVALMHVEAYLAGI